MDLTLTESSAKAELFVQRLEQFGALTAVITECGERLSYVELASRADSFAAGLGDVRRLLLIEASNEIESLVAYLGALRGGHAVIMASDGMGRPDSRLMELYRPDAVHSRVDGAWALDIRGAATHKLHPDLALLLSTSGSTGATKLVRLSQAAVEANAQSIAEYLRIGDSDRAVTTLPIHYSYGLSVVNSHLAAGAQLILTGRSVVDPEFWSLVEREQATSIAGVPYTYELLDRVGLARKTLPSLRTMTQAGGRLPPDAVARHAAWTKGRRIEFYVMYGQTEATARMAYLPPAELQAHPDCIGIAIPGGAFRLVDAEGVEIDVSDVEGELFYTGPNVMMGYAESPADLALGAVIDELATGDIACRDASGLYRITGRSSRFVKPFGLRISLDGVEAALGRLGLRGAATGDDTLIAVAILDGDAATAATALAAEFKLATTVFDVVRVDDLPLLPSGKIDYRFILAAAKTRAAEATADDPRDAVGTAFARVFPGRQIAPEDTFASLGGDSLSYVNFSLEIEARLGTLPDGWEHLSLTELKALASATTVPRKPGWRRIESEVLLRALAVIAVVINHASTLVVGGGASVLLLLVGFNMARFQRPRLEGGDVVPIVRSLVTRIILPYYAILLVYLVWKKSFDWSALLLVGNFTGHFSSLLEPYWFLEALLQCTVIVALLFSLPAVQRASRDNPWRVGMLFLGSALILKGAAFAIFRHARLFDRTPDALLYLLALGWCLYFARTRRRQLAISSITIAIAALEFIGVAETGVWNSLPYPANISHDVWLLVAVLILLWVPRLSLPGWLYVAATSIAASSFYIYLIHGVPVYVMLHVLHFDMLPLTLAISVGLGVAVGEAARRWRGRAVDA